MSNKTTEIMNRAKRLVDRATQIISQTHNAQKGVSFILNKYDTALRYLTNAETGIAAIQHPSVKNIRTAITTLRRTLNILRKNVRMGNSCETLNVMIQLSGHAFISKVAYDAKTRDLFVEFNRGTQYVYDDVPVKVWQEFARRARAGVDVGKYYNVIKEDYGPGTRVGEIPVSLDDTPAPTASEQKLLPMESTEQNKRYVRVRNFRKIENADGTVDVLIDTQGGMDVIDGKELAAVLAQAGEKSTGSAAAVKATDIKPLDAASPITQIVEMPMPNVQVIPGPDVFVSAPAPVVAQDTAAIVAVVPVSTTPESTTDVQALESVIAMNARTNNAVVTDVIGQFESMNTVDANQQIRNMMMLSGIVADPFSALRLGQNFEDTVRRAQEA